MYQKWLLTLLAVACVSCVDNNAPLTPDQKRDPTTGRVFSDTKIVVLDNGCEVHSVSVRNGPYLNMVYCPMGPTGVSWPCGKTTCHSVTAPLTVRQPTPEEVAKAAALAKLSPEDKKLLGLKE